MYSDSTRGQPTLDTWMGTWQWYADNCGVPDREQYAATDQARVRFAESRYKGSLLLTSAFERDVPVAIPCSSSAAGLESASAIVLALSRSFRCSLAHQVVIPLLAIDLTIMHVCIHRST